MCSRSLSQAVFPNSFSALAGVLVVVAASLGVPHAQAQSEGAVAGMAINAETGRPLPGVSVLVEGTERGASTDAEGRFAIGALEAGAYTLEARFVGYAPLSRKVQVPAGDTVRVRFALSPRTVGLEAVEVTARRSGPSEVYEQLQRARIQEANPRDAGELLRNMPGTGAVRRGPVGLDPVVRGLRETQIGVYVDGMRTFPAGPARMDSPLSHSDPSTMRSVEVVKGPYALTWGGGQLSAIRVETNGLWEGRPGPLHGRLESGYDTNFNAYEVGGTASGRGKGLAYRVEGAYHQGRGPYESGTGAEVPSDFLSREARAKVGYRLGEGSRLEVGGGYQQQDDVTYPGRLLSAKFFKSGRGQARYEYASGTGLVRSVEAQAYGYQALHTMNNEGKPTYEAGTFPNGTRRPPLRITVNADVTTVGGRVATELAPAPGLRLRVGGDAYRTYRDAERPFQVVNMENNLMTPGFYQSDQIWPGVTIADAGLFAQATRRFGPVEATATARTDAVWAGADEEQVTDVYLDIAEPGSGALAMSDLDQQEINVSGALMLTTPLSDTWSLSVGGGTAVRTADALERYADRFPSSKAQTSAEFIGNPQLDPERSWQADVELTARYPTGSLKLSGFARRLSNHITLTEAPDVEPMLPLPIFAGGPFRYTNGEAAFYGGEAAAAYAVLPSLTASASASYLWGKNLETDQPALGVSPLRGQVGVRYEPPREGFLNGRFFVEGTLRAAAEQDRVARVLGETPTNGYATLDLKGGIEVGYGVSLEGGVTNLTDTNYVNHLNARNPYAGTPIPEPGRVFFAGVRYRF